MPDTQVKKEVRYINRDFASLRTNLVNYAKVYFPNTYNDFNESSPGMMFIEMAAYVGDVLSYYMDSQIKELFIQHAEERKNVVNLAEALGYKPRQSFAASTTLDVFQLVPSTGTGENNKPDYVYSLIIEEGMQVSSTSDSTITFRSNETLNFNFSSSNDPTTVSIYERDGGTGEPTYYLLKKSVKASSGVVASETFTVGDPQKYLRVALNNTKILKIVSVKDSDGNTWYEVPYLAQDTIFKELRNTAENDPQFAQYNDTAPYLLKLKKTSRRFRTRIRGDNRLELQFGAGISSDPDEVIIPNPDNVGSNLPGGRSYLDVSIDPSNFLYTKAYGQIPQNTTLTVSYLTGGGLSDNVPQGDLTTISGIVSTYDNDAGVVTGISNVVKASVAVNNVEPGVGGKGPETIPEIRNNALAHFSAQNRAVTMEDYLIRIYSLPEKFGRIDKAYIVQDEQLNKSKLLQPVSSTDGSSVLPTDQSETIKNPLALNCYVLGLNSIGNLTTVNEAIKQNLKTYMGQYRILTDAVNIKDGYIVNIGVDFEIIVLAGYIKREVLLSCVSKVKDIFALDQWQFNQPIALSDIYTELAIVEGVQSVISVDIKNNWDADLGYSGNVYDIEEATKNDIIYPSMDPAVFEVKFPDSDIKGKVTTT
tara:strand:+ start:529 stop:2469 length:1941 start_codon:yes stop_codon:yes gene_type:complete